MHPTRFDAIAQALVATATRRWTLSGLLAGTLSLVGFDLRSGDAATSGACRPRCGVCQRCKRGRCKQTKQGRRCTRGRCRREPNGTACRGDRICLDGACRRRCGAGGPCHVFISSSTHNGNLGGLSGADAICQNLARAAKLPGLYKAWLSDPENWPASTFLNPETTGPYVLLDGTQIATDWADLTDGRLTAQIDVTERGALVRRSVVWTNTLPDGTMGGLQAAVHCEQWTSDGGQNELGNVGLSDETGSEWTAAGVTFCLGTLNLAHRIYCFQQG